MCMHAVCMEQSCGGHRVLGECLLEAAGNGRADGIDAMLSANAAVDYQDRLWRSPLHLACTNGHTDCVTSLLTAGADRDRQDQSGQTPIYLAAAFGHSACVEALLIANAALDIQRWDGYTPLHLAAQFSRTPCVDTILTANGAVHPIFDVQVLNFARVSNTWAVSALLLKRTNQVAASAC